MYGKSFNNYVGNSFKPPRGNACDTCYDAHVSSQHSGSTHCIDKRRKNSGIWSQRVAAHWMRSFSSSTTRGTCCFLKYRRWSSPWCATEILHASLSRSNGRERIKQCLQTEFRSEMYKQITLFSDNCGGQNPNYIVFSLLAVLTLSFGVTVSHIFLVTEYS